MRQVWIVRLEIRLLGTSPVSSVPTGKAHSLAGRNSQPVPVSGGHGCERVCVQEMQATFL